MNIVNKKVFHEYEILEKFEAGIQLLGSEVKSIRGGRMMLNGSFVRILGDEAYLVNAEIPLYPYARPDGYESKRSRKLLLHAKELLQLKGKVTQSNLTIVPLSCYTSKNFIKLQIGLARGKKEHQKREDLKKQAINRDIEQTLRGKIEY